MAYKVFAGGGCDGVVRSGESDSCGRMKLSTAEVSGYGLGIENDDDGCGEV